MKKLYILILATITSILSGQSTVINFTACNSGTTPNASDIITDQNNNIFVSSDNGLSKSTDTGITFSALSSTTVGAIVALGNKIIASNKMSIDGGSNWTNHTMFGSNSIIKFIKQSETIAIGVESTGGSFFKTTDGGATWQQLLMPSAPPSLLTMLMNVFSLDNGDILVGYYLTSTSHYYMVSKDLLTTYSYSIAVPNSNTMPFYTSGYINSNNYILFSPTGKIDGYTINQSLTAPTFTNSYVLSGATNTVSFSYGVLASNNSFLVIDANATTNSILRTAGTATTSTVTPTGLNELNRTEAITVYPNPCINALNVKGIDKEHSYIVTNQLGQIVLSGKVDEYINTTSLSFGVYFLNIKGSQKVIKFLKE